MWISDFAIRRPVITVVCMLALVVFGTLSLINLDTDEFPEIDAPVVAIAIPYPGASPDVVEQEVVEPVEEAIAAISGIDQITSQSLDGFGMITAAFVFDKDVQQATQDIRDAISQIRGDLPLEMEEPILTRFDPNDFPIVSLALTSETLGPAELTRIADPGITRDLRGLAGVAEVQVVGSLERELTVELRPEDMAAAGVGVGAVVQALQTQNLAVPVGRIDRDLTEQSIRLRGRLDTPEDFERVAVAQQGNRLVRLGEVADVRDATEEQRTLALFSGRPAVGINILKAQGSSTTSVAERVLEQVDEIQQQLPAGVDIRVVQNAGERVEASVADVESALFEGALLTVLVVFLFLNSWRSTVITGLALPVSVMASFIAVAAFGFTLNTMSLLGLSLAIGILIDDAIVVRENIVRHVHMGKDHMTAAREGTAEIGLAVAATTLSIVVVFVPIAFMQGEAGQWFKPLALTIACSVMVSLFVSFSLDPMLSAYWPDPEKTDSEKAWITRKLDVFNAWFDRQADRYKTVIGWALDHRLAIVSIALASFLGALALPALGIIGGAFFPVQDVSEINLSVETPPGSNLSYTQLKAEEAARLARGMPEVAYTYLTIGAMSSEVDQANVYVRLVPRAERDRSQAEVEAELRDQIGRIGGATVGIANIMFGGTKQIQIQVQGSDVEGLNDLAQAVLNEVRQVPGAVDIGLSTKGRKPELDVEMDRALASSLGLSVGQVAQALRPAFAGIDVGDWIDPQGETRDVTVRLAPEARSRAQDLETLPLVVPGPQGPAILPLGQVARVRESTGPAQIDRLDRERVIVVEANTQGRALSEVVADITARLESVTVPPGYTISQGGETEQQTEVFTSILTSLAIAILLMYFVLVVQFGSFLDPLAIMLSLPLSLIGVMLALLLTGTTLNLMSMIGVILLMGLVAKNAILLIDFAKWSHRDDGLPLREAIIEAGRVRLRPILMTTFALVAGMTPVALGLGEGADFRAPLGRAVIGGVLTSTFLTLLVIPTIYEILTEWREWMVSRIRSLAGRSARTPARKEARGGGYGEAVPQPAD